MEARRTALYEAHQELGARLVDFAGFAMPIQYDGILAEHERVRTRVGLFDVSHMGEIRFRGPDALDVVNRLITNDLRRVGDGRALYACMCAEDGTIVDDLIVYRLAADDILICVNAANRATDLAHMQAHARGDAAPVDEGDRWSQIAVQGPAAPALLERLFGPELTSLRPFRIAEARFDESPLYLATTGYTGERGAELYLPNALAPAVWRSLLEAGRDLGVGPAGLGARDTLRLEQGYCLYGQDIDRTTTPLEAGLEWVVRLDKPDFIGRDALAAQRDAGVPRRLVGLEIDERGVPRTGHPILSGGEVVGAITSGNRSPTTGRFIALGYVPTALAEPGTALTVDIRGKAKPARVVKPPFLKR